ncbi:MAG TPA: phasin family protein [Pseudolabrys sp.]|nr:phasin family protein [Pseudolabrys sp.]
MLARLFRQFCIFWRYRAMAVRESSNAQKTRAAAADVVNWGQHQTQAALDLQKAIVESCEHASRLWINRMQSEISLWSDLASKLSSTKSFPEALEAYTKCLSQRMQMAADDGRKLVEEAQQITQKFAQSVGNGRPGLTT